MWLLIDNGERSEILPLAPSNVRHAEFDREHSTLVLILDGPGFGPSTEELDSKLEALAARAIAQEEPAPMDALIGLVRELAEAVENVGPYTLVYEGETAQTVWDALRRQAVPAGQGAIDVLV